MPGAQVELSGTVPGADAPPLASPPQLAKEFSSTVQTATTLPAPPNPASFNVTGGFTLGALTSSTAGNGYIEGDSHTGFVMDNRFPTNIKGTGTYRFTPNLSAQAVGHLWVLDDTTTPAPEFNLVPPEISAGIKATNLLSEGDTLTVRGGLIRGAADGMLRQGPVPMTPNAGTFVVSNTVTEGPRIGVLLIPLGGSSPNAITGPTDGPTLAQRYEDFNDTRGAGVAAQYTLPFGDANLLTLNASYLETQDPKDKHVVGEVSFPGTNPRMTFATQLSVKEPGLLAIARGRVTYEPDKENDLTASGVVGIGLPLQVGKGVTVAPFANTGGVINGASEDLGLRGDRLFTLAAGADISTSSGFGITSYAEYIGIRRDGDMSRSLELGVAATLGTDGPILRGDYTHYTMDGAADVREGRLTLQMNFK